MGLPGKPDGIDGSEVHRYFREGRIKEIADYCETDIVNTYRVWLRYELFRGRLTLGDYEASENGLAGFLKDRVESKPHLAGMAVAVTGVEAERGTNGPSSPGPDGLGL